MAETHEVVTKKNVDARLKRDGRDRGSETNVGITLLDMQSIYESSLTKNFKS